MGFSYLRDKNWNQITREERFFCTHLYFNILKNINLFVDWLSDTKKVKIKSNKEWEIGYEVCFYRDYLFLNNISEKNNYSLKRTYDLCLFSEDEIIIFEAKCQQPFHKSQTDFFVKEKEQINELLPKKIKVILVSIASSIYYDNLEKYGNVKILSDTFDYLISWNELYNLYHDEVLKRADLIYKDLDKKNK